MYISQKHCMDGVRNHGGLGSDERPVGHPHFLLSPYNPADHEHNSDLLDTYERERISRELQYYVQEAAKSISNVKFNGEIRSGRPIGPRSLQRGMSMPRLPLERDTSGGGGMKKKSETKSKEMIDVSRPERDTRNGGGESGDGMKKKSETKSKEIIDMLRPERETRNGGGDGMKKKKSETKSKEIIDMLRPERETRNGGGGMKKKKSEKQSKTVSLPERSKSGDGGMKKNIETKRKAITKGNLFLKHASTVCNSSGSDVVQFGRDFLRAQVAATGKRHPAGGG